MSDWHLLNQYLKTRSEPAFAKIVERHIKMVFFTCRRELRSDQLAEDATQLVFLLLARKATGLGRNVSISGWLFKSALWISRDLSRNERRRIERDAKAVSMLIDSEEQADVHKRTIDPLINEGLCCLTDSDREAVLMRYFDDLSMTEIASVLQTSEANARKRISRSIERLREFFKRRRITVTTTVLTGFLIDLQTRTVPTTCHAAVMTSVRIIVSGPASAGASHFQKAFWKKGIYLIMEATKRKLLVIAAGGLLLLGGFGIPITRYCIARSYENKVHSIIGNGGFTDMSRASDRSAGGAISQADREAIDERYAQLTDDFNHRNINAIYGMLAPNMNYGTFDSKALMPPKQFLSRQQRFLANHSLAKIYYSVDSISVSGDQATVQSKIKFVSQATVQDRAPAGAIITEADILEEHWQKINGLWLMTRSMGKSGGTSIRSVS